MSSISSISSSLSIPQTPFATSPKHISTRTLIINTTIQGTQLLSLLSPIYALSKAIRTPSSQAIFSTTSVNSAAPILPKPKYSRFSPTLFLKRVSIGTFLIGSVGGATVGWILDTVDLGGANVVGKPGVGIRKGEIKMRDYSIIGGVVGALSTTTIFLRRVPLPYSILGGAGLGIAGGVITGLLETYKIGEQVLEGKIQIE